MPKRINFLIGNRLRYRLQLIMILSFPVFSCHSFAPVSTLIDNEAVVCRGVGRDSLPAARYIDFDGHLDNFLYRIKVERKASVAFLGGSITAGKGWRNGVMQYLEKQYPDVEWNFMNAGIPSLGSVPHAFRLERDVLSEGRVDLLFVESAVNDHANHTPEAFQRRALEGIVRHALTNNPAMNIVIMAFVDEFKLEDYASKRVPTEVAVHQEIARHYKLPFINLAKEVSDRINTGEFTWDDDFVNLHPSPFGHSVYTRTIRTMLEMCARREIRSALNVNKLPARLEGNCYDKGRYVPVDKAGKLNGFTVASSWKPADGAGTREGFVNVPVLVGTSPGDTFRFSFTGNAVGIAVVSGPDAGMIRYSIDGGEVMTIDLYTQWSHMLHLPWYLVLADGLTPGKHVANFEIAKERNAGAQGNACRIVHFLVNE